jgi:2-isopropylmalate synthase
MKLTIFFLQERPSHCFHFITFQQAYAADSNDIQLLYNDHLEVSDGSGPVDALAKALKQALLPSHPFIQRVELVDYKVRILDPQSATNAATRVMIEFRNGDVTWTTVSVDRNIISASVNALVDGFEYALIEQAKSCMVRCG